MTFHVPAASNLRHEAYSQGIIIAPKETADVSSAIVFAATAKNQILDLRLSSSLRSPPTRDRIMIMMIAELSARRAIVFKFCYKLSLAFGLRDVQP